MIIVLQADPADPDGTAEQTRLAELKHTIRRVIAALANALSTDGDDAAAAPAFELTGERSCRRR